MTDSADTPVPARDTAGAVIVAALRDEIDGLLTQEPAVRANAADSVHQMRVAARRLRSVLGTYRPLLAAAAVDRIRDELRWLGGILGTARDAEVSADLLRRELDALPAKKVRGPIADRLVGGRQADYAGAHALAVTALNSARWADLQVRLSVLVGDPPLRGRAAQPAPGVLTRLIRKDFARLRKLVDTAAATAEPDHVGALHEVRKAAKRLRYAAEAATSALGPEAASLAANAKTLQTVLGDHRDAVETRNLVDQAAELAEAAGEDQFTYRLLAKSQAKAAQKALAKYSTVLTTLKPPT